MKTHRLFQMQKSRKGQEIFFPPSKCHFKITLTAKQTILLSSIIFVAVLIHAMTPTSLCVSVPLCDYYT